VPYDESIAKEYVDALCKELELKKDSAHILKTVYFGGGTPSVLPEESFIQLFKCLRDNFKFFPIEITVETNPGTITELKIKTLHYLGVSRISIGVQSFDDNELKTLGRIHTPDGAVRAIELIKSAGIRNFSIDLIYGIPWQTMDSWKQTIEKALSFFPTHISAYELTPEKGTPLYEMIFQISNPPSPPENPPTSPFKKGGQRGIRKGGTGGLLINVNEGGFLGEIKMPDEELVLKMYDYTIDYLASFGYEHYEISNFALSGFKCIHNLNYWNRGEYIGAGAGAHSFIRGHRSKNTDNIKKYIDDLKTGIIPEIESSEINREDSIREFIFLGLRKIEGISIAKSKKLGLDIIDACKELIDECYLEVKDDNLTLTRKGIVISNEIIARILDRLKID
jgi:oxygen-independent coproporphyrinogen-3 oxidase